jgi:hypothetical protein
MSNIFDRKVSRVEATSTSIEPSENGFPSLHAPNIGTPENIPQTSSEVKQATMELLKHGYLEEAEKRELFRSVTLHEREITAALEPLDLELRLDAHRGVAFLKVAQAAYELTSDDAAWMHPLVRRQRLTLEQSLLVAILRQAFVIHEQESGIGQSAAKIAVDDLLPQFMTYFGDSGSDAKNDTRLLNLLDQLKPHGIVSEVDDKHEVTIRPLVVYLANPSSLAALLRELKESFKATEPAEHES